MCLNELGLLGVDFTNFPKMFIRWLHHQLGLVGILLVIGVRSILVDDDCIYSSRRGSWHRRRIDDIWPDH